MVPEGDNASKAVASHKPPTDGKVDETAQDDIQGDEQEVLKDLDAELDERSVCCDEGVEVARKASWSR